MDFALKGILWYVAFIRNPTFTFLGLLVAWRAFDVLYPPLHLACFTLVPPHIIGRERPR
jgi:hypothetical protein